MVNLKDKIDGILWSKISNDIYNTDKHTVDEMAACKAKWDGGVGRHVWLMYSNVTVIVDAES